MTSNNHSPQRCLVVYHFAALYREPIFRELMGSKVLDFELACDIKSIGGIEVCDTNKEIYGNRFHRLRNYWLPKGGLWQSGLLRLLMVRKYSSYLLLGDPHFLTVWLTLLWGKVSRRPVYLWTHGFTRRGGWVQRSIKLLMYRLSAGIFLYGNNSLTELHKSGVPKSHLHVVYNSLDYDLQRSYRISCELCDSVSIKRDHFKYPDRFQLIYVGRLTYHKNLEWCIEAVYKLALQNIKVNLLFVGDGEARGELEAIVMKYGLQNEVVFVGKCHDEGILAKYICSSDLCLSPGEIGLTAMHMLAYGTPCLTHSNPHGQMPEYEAIIPGYSGELFLDGDIDDMVDNIKVVMQKGKGYYSKNCISVIESRYTADRQLRVFEEFINAS